MARQILVGALVAIGLAGCLDATGRPAVAPEGCLAHDDCGEGRRCTDAGQCVDDGVTPPTSECGSSDDCRAPPTAVPNVYWDGGGPDPVCSVPAVVTPNDRGEAATVCAAAVGALPGLFRCSADPECASGRCLALTPESSLCLRSCTTDGDCPVTAGVGGPVVGFACREITLGAWTARACLPLEGHAPTETLCRSDEDCAPPGLTPPPGIGCRFMGTTASGLDALPLCGARLEPALPLGAVCTTTAGLPGALQRASASCAGGGCGVLCASNSDEDRTFLCNPLRYAGCLAPCLRDTDCPDRFACATGADSERVGRWVDIPEEQTSQPGRSIRVCTVPAYGCLDELDCCPERRADGSCLGGWSELHERCALSSEVVGGVPRLRTLCEVPAPGATPGDCCAGHDDCDSRLCVPARAGSACEGVCSTPCAPGADGDGEPRTVRDRCAAAHPSSDYHRESHCAPFDYVGLLPDATGALQELHVTLPVCR